MEANKRNYRVDKKLYYYTNPNQMQGHQFTDDVAICEAYSKIEALIKFRRIYDITYEEAEKFVREIWYNNYGVAILTDY